MRNKRSARRVRQQRNRNRRVAHRSLRCESLESRVLLDASGLLPSTVLPLPEPPAPLPPLEPGAIRGSVWEDLDGDRRRSGGEPGMGGVTVYSDLNFNGQLEAYEPSTVTQFDDPSTDYDEGGRFSLESLQPGYHNVRQVPLSGFEQTAPSLPAGYLPPPWGDASVHVTFVDQGQTVDDVDFGNRRIEPGAVRGVKWEDVNGNAEHDPDELGLPGVVIYSDRNLNGVLDPDEPHTVTMEDDPNTDFDESGQYFLEGLDPGLHWIKEVVPDGFAQTFPNYWLQHPDDLRLPFEPFPGGAAHDVVVHAGETIEGLDFGNQRILPASVHGVKWEDVNGNAQRDADEPGLAGVIIFSDQNLNGVLDPDEPRTVTGEDDPDTDYDESGTYSLENLDVGWHWIKEVVPDGYQQTFPGSLFFPPPGIPEPLDLSIAPSPVGGQPHDVFLRSGDSLEGIDFGNRRIVPGSISGVKWEDVNGDGVRNASEPGLAGVIIYLDQNYNGEFDADEPHAVTRSDDPNTDYDEAGHYSIDADPGFHYVREVVPAGYRQTFPNVGHPSPLPWLPPIDIGILPPHDGAHFVTVGSGESVEHIDFGNRRIVASSISGVKWEDANGNAEFDPWENGLAGVTIYADLNDNSSFDATEPFAITTADLPETDFDESGHYRLGGLAAGNYVIREVVPDGYQQTYPLVDQPHPLPEMPERPSDIGPDEAFATVDPSRLDLELAAGEIFMTEVSITIHPSIFVPIEIDVIASPFSWDGTPSPEVVNLSGPQLNGGTGDTSTFEIMVLADGLDFYGELLLLDSNGSDPIATIPLSIHSESHQDGGHRVTLEEGDTIAGLNFGNQSIVMETGLVSGRKWSDLNGNSERDAAEPGLAGVTIYADHNLNGRLDPGEPSTVTSRDIPETDFDEAGFFRLKTASGFQAIREIVPFGYLQTFPASDATSPLESGAHFVDVQANEHIDGLDFGNYPIDLFTASVSGVKWEDINANGQRDAGEPGLGGVTIYSDLDFDGVFDIDEPHAVTEFDIPETDYDEGGRYAIGDLAPGVHIIREVLPAGYVQIFPSPLLAIPNSDAHTVFLNSGDAVDGLDFGNLLTDDPQPLPGDFNGDGIVDGKDLVTWTENYGSPGSPAATDISVAGERMDGGRFLLWQRNLGRVSTAPVLGSDDVSLSTDEVAPASRLVDTLSSARAELVGVVRDSTGEQFSPGGRGRFDALEAAFAERVESPWQPTSPIRTRVASAEQPSSASSSPVGVSRQGVAGRKDYRGFAEAVDVALVSEIDEEVVPGS